MCTRGNGGGDPQSPAGTEDHGDNINDLTLELATANCQTLIQTLCEKSSSATAATASVTSIDSLRTAFITYLDAFQNAFRLEVKRRFDVVAASEAEPWFTDYVTLKPLRQENETLNGKQSSNQSSFKAKAQKITKKACVLLSNNGENNDDHSLSQW